jgi:hypothetical protein
MQGIGEVGCDQRAVDPIFYRNYATDSSRRTMGIAWRAIA